MEYLSLMFSTPGRGWVEGALLLGLFWAALGHPDRIRRPLELRLSALLMGVGMAASPILQLVFLANRPASSNRQIGSDGTEWFLYASAAPPILLMLAIVLAVDSVMPRGGRDRGAAG